MLTMGQTAKQAGVSKAALSSVFRIGKISANINDIGGRDVDPTDLPRVNPVSAGTVSTNSSIKRNATPANAPTETATFVARLDVEIEWVKAQMEQVKEMRKQLAHMEVRSKKWQDEAQSAQQLLTDMQPQRRGWFSFGKAIWPPKWRVPSHIMCVDVKFWGWRHRIG